MRTVGDLLPDLSGVCTLRWLCRWRTEKYKAPAFVGGPYVIWGLTGYILHRLVHDVLRKHLVIV